MLPFSLAILESFIREREIACDTSFPCMPWLITPFFLIPFSQHAFGRKILLSFRRRGLSGSGGI
jgi:hypothetical protein